MQDGRFTGASGPCLRRRRIGGGDGEHYKEQEGSGTRHGGRELYCADLIDLVQARFFGVRPFEEERETQRAMAMAAAAAVVVVDWWREHRQVGRARWTLPYQVLHEWGDQGMLGMFGGFVLQPIKTLEVHGNTRSVRDRCAAKSTYFELSM
jgi:hypothetical protein